MRIIFLLIFSIIITSCTGPSTYNGSAGFEQHSTEQFFQGSGIEKYFLSLLPVWANFSNEGRCYRNQTIHYMHLKNLRQSFGYSYVQSIQFQYLFNREFQNHRKLYNQEALPLKEEEKIFYNVNDQIRADILPFRRPDFERVHLIWIDPYIAFPEKVKTLMASASMEKGHPIIISMCLNEQGLTSYLEKIGLANMNIRLMPAEMFSIYNEEGEPAYHYGLYPKSFFNKNQKLYLFVPKGLRTQDIKGEFLINEY